MLCLSASSVSTNVPMEQELPDADPESRSETLDQRQVTDGGVTENGPGPPQSIAQPDSPPHVVSMKQRLTNADPESRSETQVQRPAVTDGSVTEKGSVPPGSIAQPNSPFNIEFVEKTLRYEFKTKRLLEQAFTDASFDETCDSYERLEHVGDSVLDLVITREFFFRYPELSPGLLTRLRAVNVDTEKLARVAVKHDLHRCLRHKKPLLEEQIKEFSEAIEEYPLHSHGLVKVPKVLADIVESTIGALFMDCNSIDTVWQVFKPLLEPIIGIETLKNHPNTELHQICQKRNMKLRFEDTWDKNKEILVYIDDQLVGRGSHRLKKDSARNIAAKDALDNLPKFLEDDKLLDDDDDENASAINDI